MWDRNRVTLNGQVDDEYILDSLDDISERFTFIKTFRAVVFKEKYLSIHF